MKFIDFVELDESINDKGIFKAMLMCGTPGAGKSYVISKVTDGSLSPRIINTDKFVEYFGKGGGVDWNLFGDKIEKLTKKQLIGYLNGLLPLWIDGTSSNPRSLLRRVGVLKSYGYDVGLVWVETDIDVAIERASKRKRVVPEEYIRSVYEKIAPLKEYYKKEFKNFRVVRNGEGELNDTAILKTLRAVNNFFLSPIENPLGIDLYNKMKEAGAKYIDQYDPKMYESMKKDVEVWYS